jgi:hypothetical protein
LHRLSLSYALEDNRTNYLYADNSEPLNVAVQVWFPTENVPHPLFTGCVSRMGKGYGSSRLVIYIFFFIGTTAPVGLGLPP